MPANTPIFGFPYPVGTDRVADGDDAIKALAERVEGILGGTVGPGWTPYVPALLGFTAAINMARYFQVGKTVVVAAHLTLNAVPTAGMAVAAPKPIAQKVLSNQLPMGVAIATIPATTFAPVWSRSATDHLGFGLPSWAPGTPGSWGNGSVLGFLAVYETT